MGALTAKKHAFTFRAWEPKTFKQCDETEVSLFYLRTEHLKAKKTRVLPINYWMADKKRFANTQNTFPHPIITFKNKLIFNVLSLLVETKITQYIISNIEGYKKIIDKLVEKKNIHLFTSKRIPVLSLPQISFFQDFPTSVNLHRKNISSFQESITCTNICLTTNPRLDSPAFNAFLFQNAYKFNIFSLSTFASNFNKKEIPMSKFSLSQILKGFININETLFIESPLNALSLCQFKNVISLVPLYMSNINNTFPKELKNQTEIILSQKKSNLFRTPFLSTVNQGDVNFQKNQFDDFIQKKISYKFMSRLFMLYSLINLQSKTKMYTPIKFTAKNASSILFQTFKTI